MYVVTLVLSGDARTKLTRRLTSKLSSSITAEINWNTENNNNNNLLVCTRTLCISVLFVKSMCWIKCCSIRSDDRSN